jgi:hypothetical protein
VTAAREVRSRFEKTFAQAVRPFCGKHYRQNLRMLGLLGRVNP